MKPAIPEEARHAAGLAALVQAGVSPAEGAAAGYETKVTPGKSGLVRVHLSQRRTGREFQLTVQCLERRFDVGTDTEDPSTPARRWMVEEAALWDRHLQLLQKHGRRALVTRALAPDQLARLASGETGLVDAAREALVEAIGALAGDAAALPRVTAVLDLLEQAGDSIPFEAQARFATIIQDGIPTQLQTIARRLGFETSRE